MIWGGRMIIRHRHLDAYSFRDEYPRRLRPGDPELKKRDAKLKVLHQRLFIAKRNRNKHEASNLERQIKRLGQTGAYGW